MKKILIGIVALCLIQNSFAQISLAVMEFKQGSNTTTNINGLSEMLINSLFESGHYDIVEQSQINYALRELGLQQNKNLTVAELTRLGKYLKVNYVLVGIVNFIATGNSPDPGFMEGEYNVDVRIVDINTARIIATAGVTKYSGQTYRSLMPELASQLSVKLSANSLPCIQGYLYVYPEYLGKASYEGAEEKCQHLNAVNACGRDTWRLPSIDELKMIADNLNLLNFPIEGTGRARSNRSDLHADYTCKKCYRCSYIYYYDLLEHYEGYDVAECGDDQSNYWVILVSTK